MRRLWALVLAVLLLSACAAPEEEPEVDWGAYQQELPAESGAPEEPEEPAPVTLEWKSEFNVEKYEKELAEKKEADHDGQ